MMRSSILALLVTTAALAACQTEALPASQDHADLTGASCGAQMPKIDVWNGAPPPGTGWTQMYLLFAPQDGYALAALVDYGAASVPYATYVPEGKRTTFITLTQEKAGRIVTGGNPPPPPDVIPPDKLAAFLVASAIRYADVPAQAAGDVAACK